MEEKLPMKKKEEKGKEVTKERKEQLYNRVNELKHANAALLAENDMLERFISRLDPQDLLSQSGEDSLEAAAASQLEGGGRRRRSRSSIADRPHQLTLEQKLYVAQREVQETHHDQEKLKHKYEGIQDDYKASLKEAELRLAEIRKSKKEFERKVHAEPEMVLQYIGDKSVVVQLEKFKQKNQALKLHEKNLQHQLQHRKTQKETDAAEFEDVFQDFGALRIHQNLDELQVKNLKMQLVLSSHKEKLQNVTQESTELSSDISNMKQMLAKIEEDMQRAEKERLKAEALNQHLHCQMTDYQAPDIPEYMQVKDRHKKLQRSIHTWERKVGIAQMALRSHAKAWSTQRATVTPNPKPNPLPIPDPNPPSNRAEAGARPKEHQISVKLPYI